MWESTLHDSLPYPHGNHSWVVLSSPCYLPSLWLSFCRWAQCPSFLPGHLSWRVIVTLMAFLLLLSHLVFCLLFPFFSQNKETAIFKNNSVSLFNKNIISALFSIKSCVIFETFIFLKTNTTANEIAFNLWVLFHLLFSFLWASEPDGRGCFPYLARTSAAKIWHWAENTEGLSTSLD